MGAVIAEGLLLSKAREQVTARKGGDSTAAKAVPGI